MPNTILDSTPVLVFDAELAGEPVWRGPISEFEDANDLAAEERFRIRAGLAMRRQAFLGGGAAPAYRVEID